MASPLNAQAPAMAPKRRPMVIWAIAWCLGIWIDDRLAGHGFVRVEIWAALGLLTAVIGFAEVRSERRSQYGPIPRTPVTAWVDVAPLSLPRARHAWQALLLLGALAFSGAAWHARQQQQFTATRAHLAGVRTVELVGDVLQSPKWQRGSWRFEFKPMDSPRLQVFLFDPDRVWDETLWPGDRVHITGRLAWPQPAGNPGQFDYARYLGARGVSALLYASAPPVRVPHPINPGLLIGRGVARIRAEAEAVLHRFTPETTRGLLEAMVFGGTSALTPAVESAFQDTGLRHLLSVSGLHVGLLGAGVWALLRPAPNRLRVTLLIVAVWGYVLAVGAPASAVRAGIAVSIATSARALGWVSDGLSTLALAAFLLLFVNPSLLFDIGFQLSFVATAAILLFTHSWERDFLAGLRWLGAAVLSNRGDRQAGLSPLPHRVWASRFAKWTARGLAVSLSAQAAVTPILVGAFQTITPYAVIANLGAAPLFAFTLGTAAAGTGILVGVKSGLLGWGEAVLSAIAPWTLMPATIGARLLLGYVNWWQRVPGTVLEMPALSAPVWALWYGSLAVWCLHAPGRTRLRRSLICVLAAGVLLAWGPVYRALKGEMQVIFIDVGQGDAVLVRTPLGATLMIDGGGRAGSEDGGRDVGYDQVLPFLRRLGIRKIDYVVVTHPHTDHVQGLLAVLRERVVTEAVIAAWTAGAGPFGRDFVREAHAKGIPIRVVGVGDRLQLERSLALEILNPPKPLTPWQPTPEAIFMEKEPEGSEVNNQSLVMRLRYGSVGVLFTGDIERAAQATLVTEPGPSGLRADILHVPHHGGLSSYWPWFLRAVSPEHAIIQVGANGYGMPSERVLAALDELDTTTWRTDRHGSIQVSTNGQYVKVRSFIPQRGR